ncbi:MAG: tRNA (N(6)-L-threonylcarbamoyladenosine(37)-C(2))-methylthiotransferase MtaB [Spirochaetes bacterium]|uniref:tRNA (N(6)-L-threonylcarbamoyladenosine(37)-C(2))-methylthiotransferase MtaB n=1 Tax=Candidatus Ornithospirochaeta stercoripullorum TaxID=2840899 RepID=A0A9D9H575_9SPIO|nr:tRNA (N(6)-L-threonylcarbamoyladenosine(37)-C(2))-methylthiotransferase MtaB [Candidatus Ornithospirochaeta stercoripullorum]
MNVYIYTLGCRLNQAESEAIADSFSRSGFSLTGPDEADIVIVNSCTVTQKAEQKARRMIRLFARKSEVIVTGCYASVSPEEVEKLSDRVTIFSLKEKASLLSLPRHLAEKTAEGMPLHDAIRSFSYRSDDPFAFDASSFQYHSRAYLKIQDGCDNSCGYCRTTIARGSAVSLSADEVVRRALNLEAEGFHEIMLTGVNLTMYDHDGDGLGALVEKLLAKLGSGMRLRLSSMEPDHVDDRLLDTLADKRMQPHFHIPIQSASDKVLAIASRRYSISHVDYIISRMRKAKDDPFIACDVIAGLPGEGEKEFGETYAFLRDHEFAAMHVFPYSPRPGTPLYKAHHPEERIRDERAKLLRELSEKQSEAYLRRQLGKSVEILAESGMKGTTGNYLKGLIVMPEGRMPISGMIYSGVITSISPFTVNVCSQQ